MTTVLPLQRRGISDSRLALGCMSLGGGWNDEPITAEQLRQGRETVEAALECGITLYDHADVYKHGKAERVFGHALKEQPGLREQIVLQSKCGIRFPGGDRAPHRYDFSGGHIVGSVESSLERLGTAYLDILLLHRPDPLLDPEEVAEAIHRLKTAGKVRYFGVSNMSAAQMQLLQTYCDEPLIVNQMEMSLLQTGFVDTGVHINQAEARDSVFPEGLMEHCRMKGVQLQAWGPLAKGLLSGRDLGGQPERVVRTAELVRTLAREKETAPEAIVLAWLLRHPSAIQPVIGTANPDRIRACAQAEQVALSREEWYMLYLSSRGLTKMP
ncbi:aldo/keto reductase [Paenibacillus sp. IB182496]|uniref:Aldo/keto reductase n=1 Tax=Paenibacillus sabuli TaxID=2772509 RepID=A0A927BST3_9BACL|nr:aldo/keto reductase [Paenibacillus sabuli]MBD2844778.1 aldo/keto reductase [Paenibacillus sabuli]